MTYRTDSVDRDDLADSASPSKGQRSGYNAPLKGIRVLARCMPLQSPGCGWATSVPT